MTRSDTQRTIDELLAIMATLRHPEHGCAWDVAQTASSIVPYTLEEAYEVAEAVAAGDAGELRDELGDLLLQVVFQAQIAAEKGEFDFHDVVRAILEKLIRRHPHVFDAEGQLLGPGRQVRDPVQIAAMWQQIKGEERLARSAKARVSTGSSSTGPLSGIARALPALARAEKLSRRAASYGFDWSDPTDVLAKVREEIDEVEDAMAKADPAATAEEVGDLLFSVANLARHLGIDPEDALRKGNTKFERRFGAMATTLERAGHTLGSADLDAMETAWRAVKETERKPSTISVDIEYSE